MSDMFSVTFVFGSAHGFGCSVWRWVIVAFSAERFVCSAGERFAFG
jgi:hypothetical protein